MHWYVACETEYDRWPRICFLASLKFCGRFSYRDHKYSAFLMQTRLRAYAPMGVRLHLRLVFVTATMNIRDSYKVYRYLVVFTIRLLMTTSLTFEFYAHLFVCLRAYLFRRFSFAWSRWLLRTCYAWLGHLSGVHSFLIPLLVWKLKERNRFARTILLYCSYFCKTYGRSTILVWFLTDPTFTACFLLRFHSLSSTQNKIISSEGSIAR